MMTGWEKVEYSLNLEGEGRVKWLNANLFVMTFEVVRPIKNNKGRRETVL